MPLLGRFHFWNGSSQKTSRPTRYAGRSRRAVKCDVDMRVKRFAHSIYAVAGAVLGGLIGFKSDSEFTSIMVTCGLAVSLVFRLIAGSAPESAESPPS